MTVLNESDVSVMEAMEAGRWFESVEVSGR